MKKLEKFLLVGLCTLLFGCHTHGREIEMSSSSISSSEESSIPSSSYPDDYVFVESIGFAKDEFKIAYHKSLSIKPQISPSNATNKAVKWSSSNSEIISVNNTGYIYAWEIGTVTLRCETTDGSGLFAEISVESYSNEVSNVELDFTSKEAYIGENFQLKATVYPSNASFKDLTYSSDNTKVATVDELSGLVTCVGVGTANIKAISVNKNIFATCTVTVKSIDLYKFSLRANEIQLHENDTYKLISKFVPENASNKKVTYKSSNTKIATVDENGVITGKKAGDCVITATSDEKKISDTCKVHVTNDDSILLKTTLNYNYKDYFNNIFMTMDCAPAHNTTNFLVVPIWFTDSKNCIKVEARENVRQDIQAGFFGTNEETGWRSVKTYYEEESFGKFKLGGMVTKWFECGASSSKYKDDNTGTYLLTSTVLEWFHKVYPEVDLRDYDSDSNGYIDALIMVYAAPDYASSGDYSGGGNFWAYCGWKGYSSYSSIDNPVENCFMWCSYDFMYSRDYAYSRTQQSGYGYGSKNFKIDTHTFIHESGHLLGLSDYYDYSNYSYSPGAGFSMQDHNVGMHDPYSVMALGWTNPYIPTESCNITINDFATSGDVILLTPEFNDNLSPFDEYLLIELFAKKGLNYQDATTPYKWYGTVDGYGIRVWHIDARLIKGYNTNNLNPKDITTLPVTNDGTHVYHATSNTYYYNGQEQISFLGKNYSDFNIMQMIKNNTEVSHKSVDYISSSDFFHKGDTFTMAKFKKQFVNAGLLNSNKELGWSFKVENLSEDSATIAIYKD